MNKVWKFLRPLRLSTPSRDDGIARQVEECRLAHAGYSEDGYYCIAEPAMDQQWAKHIWPRIQGFDLSSTVDLAAGHGRNTEKLRHYAQDVYLVDVNESCINACRARFSETDGRCRFHFLVNDGLSLHGLADECATAVYSWDAMVHFDTRIVQRYIQEFRRVLRPGGSGFIHTSNYGHIARGQHWQENPSWRSDTTWEEVRDYIKEAGLDVVTQDPIHWNGTPALDCISVFRRPK